VLPDLVLDGVFEDEHGTYPKGSWLRSPHLSARATGLTSALFLSSIQIYV